MFFFDYFFLSFFHRYGYIYFMLMRPTLSNLILMSALAYLFYLVFFPHSLIILFLLVCYFFLFQLYFWYYIYVTNKKYTHFHRYLPIALVYFALISNYLFNNYSFIFELIINFLSANAYYHAYFFFTGFYFFYLSSVFLCYIFANYLGLWGIFFYINSALLSLTLFSYYFFYKIFFFDAFFYINLGSWFNLGSLCSVKFILYIDIVSISFLFLTLHIALFVNFFSLSYFRGEPNIAKLIIMLNFFVASMTILVLAGNLPLLLLGWELIGISSFLLINFWSTRAGTFRAAFKAYAFNKISDVFLLATSVLLIMVAGDVDIYYINSLVFYLKDLEITGLFTVSLLELVALCIIIPASIKSAQIIAHIWLPDSMEAPVPASALIHSATLVSAGIFLLMRFYPILSVTTTFNSLVPVLGALTAFIGGVSAAVQTDVKKILAYSTISHCGFLFYLTTIKVSYFVILYLYVHGLFKACAFLSIGNVIIFSQNYQDLRRMGQFFKYLPFDFSILLVCLGSLSGLPFFFGFLLKHELIILIHHSASCWLILINLLFGSIAGIFYFYRLINFIFFDTKKARFSIYFSGRHLSNKMFTYSSATSVAVLTLFLIWIFCILTFLYYNFSPYFMDDYSAISSIFLNDKEYFAEHLLVKNFFNFFNITVNILLYLLIFLNWNKYYNFNYQYIFLAIIFILLL